MQDTNGNIMSRSTLRELYHDYKGEVLFFVIMAVCIVLSHWLSHYIPVDTFENIITPLQNAFAVSFCLMGSWLMFAHSEGMRIRKIWGYTLLIWGLIDASLLFTTYVFHIPILNIGVGALTAFELLVGNLLGWLFLIYPTETLRPGWLTIRRSLIQLLPMFAVVGLNYLLPIDLSPVIVLFPVVLGILLLAHIRAYRQWCEENFSSMDFIDVQWIMRYMIMLLLIGVSYMYLYISTSPTRAFTQQWLLILFILYSTEQILFRRDPWQALRSGEDVPLQVVLQAEPEVPEPAVPSANAEQRKQLEAWMETVKPFLNPEFRLMDLSEVLPMNRTYLSQLINAEYGCSFYQFANKYRIDEAKRLLREKPYLSVQEVASLSGFSSRVVFSNAFSKETGVSPREWSKQCNNT